LVVEVIGVLAAAATVRAVAAMSWAAAITAVAAVVGVAVLWTVGWPAVGELREQEKANAALSRAALNNAGGARMGAREDFLAWADQRMPRRDRVLLVCTPECGGMEQWVAWRLLPRPLVNRRQDADWILMYNALPRDVGLSGRDARRAERFGKRLYLSPVPR
jgi:hypothetical protein